MAAATTGLVLALTAVAPLVGARMSGLLATYPLFGAVLAAFAHRLSGATAAGRVLRGLLIGLFGFTGFFLLLALAIQGGSLWAMRRLRPKVTPLRQ